MFSTLIVAVLAAVGCTDAGPVDPRVASLHPLGSIRACTPDMPDYPDCTGTGGGGSGPGGGIDPNDSYVTGDVTVRSSTSVTLPSGIYDPVTDQVATYLTESAPDEHIHVAAGYSTSYATIVNTSFTDPVDPNTSPSIQVTQAGLYSDNLTESNSAGQQMTDQQPSDATAETPMDILGSTQNGDVTAGVIVDLTDTTSVHSNAMMVAGATTVQSPQSPKPAARRTLARAAVQAEQTGPQVVSIDGRYLRVEVTRQQQLQLTDVSASDAAMMPSGVSAATAPVRGSVRHSRLFTRVRDKWLLSEVHTTLMTTTASGSFTKST